MKINKVLLLLADRVLILPDDESNNVTKSGIILPPDAKTDEVFVGTVKYVATGSKEDPMKLEPGMKVVYGKYAGSDIEVDGKIHKVMRQGDVILICE